MVLVSLLAAQVIADQSMKIAVAAADKTATATVIDRAASAPYFLSFLTEKGSSWRRSTTL